MAKLLSIVPGMSDKPALPIIEAIGPARLEAIGFNERLIRHVRSSGTFAAGWYRAIRAECEAIGAECPLDAFNWKDAAA